MSLIETLQRAEPRKGILFLAIEHLVTQEDIGKFYTEHVAYVAKYELSFLAKRAPEEAAKRNIGYALLYYPKDIRNLWMKVIPELEEIFPEIDVKSSSKIAKLAKMFLSCYGKLRNIT